jgi:hypothetical protein
MFKLKHLVLALAITFSFVINAQTPCDPANSPNLTADIVPAFNSTTYLSCANTELILRASSTTNGTAFEWVKQPNTTVLSVNPNFTVTEVGTYSVTAIGTNGCKTSKNIEVTKNIDVPANLTIISACNGAAVALVANSTTNATTFQWIGGNPFATNPVTTQGTYTVVATHPFTNCTASLSRTINPANPLPVDITGNLSLCGAGSSTVLTAVGGTPNDAYFWTFNGNTIPNQVSSTLTVTETGKYGLRINGPGGCFGTKEVDVTGGAATTPTVPTNTVCGCKQAVATALTTGTPKTFLWYEANDRSSRLLKEQTNVLESTYLSEASGTVYVFIKDGDCYSAGAPVKFNILPVPNITPSVSAANIVTTPQGRKVEACGKADITASASSTGTTIEWWSTPNQEAGTRLAEGTSFSSSTSRVVYVHEVKTDVCDGSTIKCYGPPVVLDIIINPVPTVSLGSDVSTCSTSPITLTPSVSGGTPSYNYAWSNGSTNSTINVSTSGTYKITVTDSKGCTAIDEVVVTNGSGITVNAGNDVTICGTSNVTLSASATGGNGAYTYKWSNGATTQSITTSSTGIFKVTVTDGNGCSGTDEVEVKTGSGFAFSVSKSDIKCHGEKNGKITATVSNSGTYEYSINGTTFQPSNVFDNLAAKTYTVSVRLKGTTCVSTQSIEIKEPQPLRSTVKIFDISCNDETGKIVVTATGGTALYTYKLDNGTFGSSNTFSDLKKGKYTITVKDANGCTDPNYNLRITNSEPLKLILQYKENTSCNAKDGKIYLRAYGGSGNETYTIDNGKTFSKISNFKNLEAGTYICYAKDANGCLSNKLTINITQQVITFSTFKIDITCGHKANGVIVVYGRGNCWGYQYSCDGGKTYQWYNFFYGLAAGKYSIVVKDNKGCISAPTIVEIINKCNVKPLGRLAAVENTTPTQFIPVVMWQAAPNPVVDVVEVKVSSLTEREQEFVFFNVNGQPMKREKRRLEKGEQKVQFDCSQMPSGLYQIVTPGTVSKTIDIRFIKM